MNLEANRERLEMHALNALTLGAGMHPAHHLEGVDHLFIGWPLEAPDRPIVIFRNRSHAVAVVEFRVVAVPAGERTDYEKFLHAISHVDVPPDKDMCGGAMKDSACATPLPRELIPFVTTRQWKRLGLHRLEPSDRELVLRILLETFRGTDPEKVYRMDVAESLDIVNQLADDFSEPFDCTGYGRTELKSGAEEAKQFLSSGKRAKKTKGRRGQQGR